MHIRYLYSTQHVYCIWLTATNAMFTESTQFPLCLVLTNNTLIPKCSSFHGYYNVSDSKKVNISKQHSASIFKVKKLNHSCTS